MDKKKLIDYKFITQIVEALLFASDVPLSMNKLLSVIDNVKTSDIERAIDELNAEYESSERTFRVRKLGGGYQLVTEARYAKYIKNLFKGRAKPQLSQAAFEALAIIAFKQPISRPEIDQIRGVNSDGVVKTLLERNLITITGRSEHVGHALLYGTTPEFLRYFGINNITDLPKPRELEELLGSTQEEFRFAKEGEEEAVIEQLSDLPQDEILDEDEIE
ncbi:SMC-Scp complex subunit ScpB [candidate division KSB1 bacterium]|nr:SMC-Scp complex subunit ScpB [candidate division KSB1 bacterium]